MPRETKTNRRDFLRCNLAAASAVAVPAFIPRQVLGSPTAPAANDRIVLGIIGAGTRGDQLSMNVPKSGRVAAICDANLRKTAALTRSQRANWKVYQDYRKMIDQQKDLDAVIVCPCDHHHVLASILACQAGMDVYCEKPLSLYVREGRALVQAARKHERIVQTGTQQRTMEMNRFSCEFVRDGGIGRILAIECVNFKSPIPYPAKGLSGQPIPTGLDWDLWQGQAPTRPFNTTLFKQWGRYRDYANWSIAGMGTHAFDMVQYALGMDESGPVESWPVEEGPNARLRFRYANGVEVRLSFPGQRPFRGPRLGAIFTGADCKIEINRNKFTTNPSDFIKDGADSDGSFRNVL